MRVRSRRTHAQLYDSCGGGIIEKLSQGVLTHLQRRGWLKAGNRVGIAVSGGADSVALLRAMLGLRGELGIVVSVVHFNHTLRAEESDADHAFVQDLARAHDLELHEARGDVARRAEDRSLSTEAAAREARYEFFWSLIESNRLDKIATAHTLDDQAETILLRLVRGTGTRGFTGIHPELTGPSRAQRSRGLIVRPLLHTRRRNVERYLTTLGQPWREDSSNRDLRHTRNRVRQSLIPLLEKDFNPEITERLADFADIAQSEEAYWHEELQPYLKPGSLLSQTLVQIPLALRRRLVRALAPPGVQIEFRQVEEILQVAAGNDDSPPACNLAEGWTFQRQEDALIFVPPEPRESRPAETGEAGFGPLLLPIPGKVIVPGSNRAFQAAKISLASPPSGYNPEHLYAPHLLPGELLVRAWRFGDRFWPAHSKAPKKLKELFQAKKIPAEQRASWPVMVRQREGYEEVVWVRGFAAPADFRPAPGDREAVWLLEVNPETEWKSK